MKSILTIISILAAYQQVNAVLSEDEMKLYLRLQEEIHNCVEDGDCSNVEPSESFTE